MHSRIGRPTPCAALTLDSSARGILSDPWLKLLVSKRRLYSLSNSSKGRHFGCCFLVSLASQFVRDQHDGFSALAGPVRTTMAWNGDTTNHDAYSMWAVGIELPEGCGSQIRPMHAPYSMNQCQRECAMWRRSLSGHPVKSSSEVGWPGPQRINIDIREGHVTITCCCVRYEKERAGPDMVNRPPWVRGWRGH